MNPGKLEDLGALELIFTPSFNLLELEARILRHGQLEELALKIAHCVRCGKCKPDCCVFYPARGPLLPPAQQEPGDRRADRGAALRRAARARRRASSCCATSRRSPTTARSATSASSPARWTSTPARSRSSSAASSRPTASSTRAPATRATLAYLESDSPARQPALPRGACSAPAARPSASWRGRLALRGPCAPPPGRGAARSSVARCRPPTRSGCAIVLPVCEPDQALVFEPDGAAKATVFYFPGCGSERLYGSVGLAALHLLLERGRAGRAAAAVPLLRLPGLRQRAHRDARAHRAARRDPLRADPRDVQPPDLRRGAPSPAAPAARRSARWRSRRVFGCPVADASRLALELGPAVALAGRAPLPRPLPRLARRPRRGAARRGGAPRSQPVPHCCSEAGTLALSRPDITGAMLHRKRAALAEARSGRPGASVLLTNCPSCLHRPRPQPRPRRRAAPPRGRAGAGALGAGLAGSAARARPGRPGRPLLNPVPAPQKGDRFYFPQK